MQKTTSQTPSTISCSGLSRLSLPPSRPKDTAKKNSLMIKCIFLDLKWPVPLLVTVPVVHYQENEEIGRPLRCLLLAGICTHQMPYWLVHGLSFAKPQMSLYWLLVWCHHFAGFGSRSAYRLQSLSQSGSVPISTECKDKTIFFQENLNMLSKTLKIITPITETRNTKQCELALLWIRVKKI